jgi:hypothetical protein
MEGDTPTDNQFSEIVSQYELDTVTSVQRVLDASEDRALVTAMHDSISAHIEALFPFGGELPEVYEKNYDDAKMKLDEVAIEVQAHYNLSDEQIQSALEYTALAIQKSLRSPD